MKRRRRYAQHFAAIPVEVLTCDACRTLPHYARTVLLAIAAQYRGKNNGDLALTWKTSRPYGIDSKKQLCAALDLLQERRLVRKTRQGGKRPLGPSLYALTWQPIDECGGKHDVRWGMTPSDDWASWKPSDGTTEGAEP